MPKDMRIKMDVRHGEVKLAESTRNLNANLSHSSLWAAIIDGKETRISASYSPVKVQTWKFGELRADYSKNVELQEVIYLTLKANSSEVIIDQVLKKAFIRNDFGPLRITSIANDFEDMDISLKNAELTCKLPEMATKIYIKGSSSHMVYPSDLYVKEMKNGNTQIVKGHRKSNNTNRSIVITADYSDLILE